MNNNFKGSFLAILAASLWGLMGIAVRALTAQGFSGFEISFVRCLLAGAAFFLLCACTQPQVLRVSLRGLIISMLYGTAAYSASFVSYSIAVSRISVAVATVLMFMSPIWVSLLEILLFHEKIRRHQVISIIVCLIGGILVSNILAAGTVKLDMVGILFAMVNGMGVALQIVIPRCFADRYPPKTMLVYGFLGAALALAPLADFSSIWAGITGPAALSTWGQIIFLGIFCTMVANAAFVLSANYISSTTSSILSALEVVVSVIVGFLIFHETLSWIQISGTIIVMCGALVPRMVSQRLEKARQSGTNPS